MDETGINQRAGTELIDLLIHTEYQLGLFVFQFITQAMSFRRREGKRQQLRFLLFLKDLFRDKCILGGSADNIDLPVRPGQESFSKKHSFREETYGLVRSNSTSLYRKLSLAEGLYAEKESPPDRSRMDII